MEIKVSAKNFDREVIESDVPVVVEFYATWSTDCRLIDEALSEKVSRMGRKAKLCKIDIDKDPDIASDYNVSNVPMLVFFENGDIVSWLESGDLIIDGELNENEIDGIF